MLDFDDRPRQVHAGVGLFFDTQGAIGVIKKCHLGYFVVDNGDILGGFLTDDMMRGGLPFNYGIISTLAERNLDTAVPIGHKCAYGVAIRTDDFKPAAADRDLCASLIFEDTQAGIIFDGWAVSVIAVCAQLHGSSRISIYHIVLEISILICFLTNCKKDGIFINVCAERKLDAAGFSSYTF